MRREVRHDKIEKLGTNFTLARSTEEKLLQMAERVETADKEQKKFIERDMEEMKKRDETVNENSESRNENGHDEQRPSREFLCYTV